jgi:hypothetical protein
MKVATISMPKEKALAAYREYKEHARTAQDRAVMTGYRAIARGRAIIIKPREAIAQAGFDALCRPLLAMARADARTQRCQVRPDDVRLEEKPRWTFSLPREAHKSDRWLWYTAQVPYIPPAIRPADAQLRHYWILWEADWKAAPRDPMLLKKLDGDLYVVLAAWDLTDLERAAMGRL